jgi:hypothetical protein
MTYDANGLEREPFDGRFPPLPSRRRRVQAEGHGPDCSRNPEIGCVCGAEERSALRAEAAEARRYPNAATEGVRP